MYLDCKNVVFIAVCLASLAAYAQQDSDELLTNRKETYFRSKRESETKQNDAKEVDLGVSNITWTSFLPSTLSILNILNISHSNNEGAIEILKDTLKTEVINENNRSTKTDTLSNIAADDKSSSSEILLTELVKLSHNDGEEQIVGQKINFLRSSPNSDTDETNSTGVEILRNVSMVCGRLFGKRISFANETTLMEFPWTALLLYNTKIRYHCGGSLVTTKYVLTAAHCVAQEFYELTGVRLGEHDVTENPDCAPDLVGEEICATTIDVNVVKIVIHHAYSHLSFKNDIALLKLDNEYYSRSYYPICIPTPGMTFSATMGTVAGWGATEKTIRSAVLLKADVPILAMEKCSDIYRHSTFNDTTEICGSGVNEIDVCKGDSGGALFFRENIKGKDKFYQLGIISLGVRRCGDSRFLPAVFTKLNAFHKWIENNLEY